jgi:hypothetical protein
MKPALPTFALAAAAAVFGGSLLAQPAPPQPEFVWPERITNAQVLPADIGAEQLRRTMVTFARSLGVRCTFCHVGPEGAPLTQLDFVSDANPHKNIARGMIRMVGELNGGTLPGILGPSEETRVTCYTCHHGSAEPATMLPAPQAPAAPQPPAPPVLPPGERGAR